MVLSSKRHGLQLGTLRVQERKLDVARGRAAGTNGSDAARGALVAGGTDALLPLGLCNVDGGALGGGLEGEAGGAGLADGRGRVALAGGDVTRDATTDGKLGGVLVMEDNVAGLSVS